MGVDICDKWAPQRYRLALIYENEKGQLEQYTFWDLKRLSNRLANGLKAHGLSQGDRMGIMLPQSPEAGISHIAIYKTGAIAIPLFTLFGTDGLAYRLGSPYLQKRVSAEHLEEITFVWDKWGWMIYTIFGLIPVFPVELLAFICGFLKTSLTIFLALSFIPRFITFALSVYFGQYMGAWLGLV